MGTSLLGGDHQIVTYIVFLGRTLISKRHKSSQMSCKGESDTFCCQHLISVNFVLHCWILVWVDFLNPGGRFSFFCGGGLSPGWGSPCGGAFGPGPPGRPGKPAAPPSTGPIHPKALCMPVAPCIIKGLGWLEGAGWMVPRRQVD